MKSKIAMMYLVVGAMLAPLAGYADDSDTDRSHPVTFVKDSVITTKIKSKLAAEHITSLGHIQVDTDAKGQVWLTGNARTQSDIDKAVSVARNTEGVVSVTNRLTIKKDD